MKLKTSIKKPKFVSDVEIFVRPKMKAVFLSGTGDPLKTFDEKLEAIFDWLKSKNIKINNKPTFGIYYKDRDKAGVENVEWDACVPLSENYKNEKKFKIKIIPKTKVINITLLGGYELIRKALDYLDKVAKGNNIKYKLPLIEIYLKESKSPITQLQYEIV